MEKFPLHRLQSTVAAVGWGRGGGFGSWHFSSGFWRSYLVDFTAFFENMQLFPNGGACCRSVALTNIWVVEMVVEIHASSKGGLIMDGVLNLVPSSKRHAGSDKIKFSHQNRPPSALQWDQHKIFNIIQWDNGSTEWSPLCTVWWSNVYFDRLGIIQWDSG